MEDLMNIGMVLRSHDLDFEILKEMKQALDDINELIDPL
jgi:hypothetical protein